MKRFLIRKVAVLGGGDGLAATGAEADLVVVLLSARGAGLAHAATLGRKARATLMQINRCDGQRATIAGMKLPACLVAFLVVLPLAPVAAVNRPRSGV